MGNPSSKPKKKSGSGRPLKRAGACFTSGAFVATLGLTVAANLSSTDAYTSEWAPGVAVGNLGPLLGSSAFWSSFPSVAVSSHALLQPIAIGLVLGLVVVCVFMLRKILRRSWAAVGFAILAACIAPAIACSFGTVGISAATAVGSTQASLLLAAMMVFGGVVTTTCAVLDLCAPKLHDRTKRVAAATA